MDQAKPYGVYVRADDEGRVMAVNSDAFLADAVGWVKIDEGYGDRYHHAQGNYLPEEILDDRGVCRYRMDGAAIVERTREEMDADAARIVATPTQEARISALEEQNQMLIACLLEMSQQVYA